MKYVISGGEFVNKGAEAMLISTVNEIKRNDKEAIITALIGYGEIDETIVDGLGIRAILYSTEAINSLLDGKIFSKYLIKNKIKLIVNRAGGIKIDILKKVLLNADYYFDISGYGLTSRWPLKMNNLYLNRILLALKLNPKCKVVLLPQSFGPFNYLDSSYVEKIESVLRQCYLIFARERIGYQNLIDLKLENVRKSYDSVVMEPSMSYEALEQMFSFTPIDVLDNSVAIVPNVRIFDKTDVDENTGVKFYSEVINRVLVTSNAVYLIPHSGEDINSCKEIKREFSDDDRVILVENIYHSFEFQYIASKLKYIVASRFHSIVHSYKEGTPAVIIGWAEKYEELAEAFDQEQYIVKINESKKKLDEVLNCIENNYRVENEIIIRNLKKIQSNSCFDFLAKK